MKKLVVLLLILTALAVVACGSPEPSVDVDAIQSSADAAAASADAAAGDAGDAASAAEAAAGDAAAAASAAEAAASDAAAAAADASAAQAAAEAAQAVADAAAVAPAAVEEPAEEPAGEEVALIQGRTVEQVWSDTCSGCHGVFREGSLGPALNPSRQGMVTDPNILFDIVKNGRPGTSMDPFGGEVFMEDDEVMTMVEFILSEPEEGAFVWGMAETMGTVEFMVDPATLSDTPTHDGNMDNLMLVTERDNRGIVVIDGDTHTRLARMDATYRAHGYTFDPSNERWAYNLGRDGWLLKIDLYTLQAVAQTRIGIDSRGIAISDDGKYVIGGNYIPNTAVILDTETMEPVKVITAEGDNLDGEFVKSRVCGINQTLTDLGGPYFLMNLKDAGQVWRIDYSDPSFPIVKVEGVGNILHEGFLNAAQDTFYVASQASDWMAAIDVATMEIVEQIPAGAKPHPGAGAIWEDSAGVEYGSTLHIQDSEILIWDTDTNTEAATLPTAGPGLFIIATEASPYIWADAVFNPDGANVFHAIEKDPPFTMYDIVIEDSVKLVHPEPTVEGDFVYIADWGADVVYVLDAYTFEVVTVIEDIVTPTGIFNSSRRHETLGH
ncbi:MAG: hypothetical protein GY803_05275 [Chloroflexi bacterium]|nr:hypothetical protein [Chloroflexota bacterium]